MKLALKRSLNLYVQKESSWIKFSISIKLLFYFIYILKDCHILLSIKKCSNILTVECNCLINKIYE